MTGVHASKTSSCMASHLHQCRLPEAIKLVRELPARSGHKLDVSGVQAIARHGRTLDTSLFLVAKEQATAVSQLRPLMSGNRFPALEVAVAPAPSRARLDDAIHLSERAPCILSHFPLKQVLRSPMYVLRRRCIRTAERSNTSESDCGT